MAKSSGGVTVGRVEVDAAGLREMLHDGALRQELKKKCEERSRALDSACSGSIHDKRGVTAGLFDAQVVDAGNCLVGVVYPKRAVRRTRSGAEQRVCIGLSITNSHGGFSW